MPAITAGSPVEDDVAFIGDSPHEFYPPTGWHRWCRRRPWKLTRLTPGQELVFGIVIVVGHLGQVAQSRQVALSKGINGNNHAQGVAEAVVLLWVSKSM